MKSLFDATSIGPMTLKNRLWRAATWERMADDKGHMTPELMKIYESLAKGGVGTIITGYAFVREEEQPNPRMMGIYSDFFISDMSIAIPEHTVSKIQHITSYSCAGEVI